MGRLLERLIAESQPAPAAIPAIPAIPGGAEAQESQNRKNRTGHETENAPAATPATLPGPKPRKIAESQGSQGVAAVNVEAQRARLLALAADELLPAGLVHGLDDGDVAACGPYSDAELRGYLRALVARERMDAGMVPLEWGGDVAGTCEGCGPVLLWADCPAVVKACPWCFRRKAGKAIARPCPACGTRGCDRCRDRESLPSMSGLVTMTESRP